MPIHVTCPGCNAAYALADSQAGKKVRCKKCEAIITVEAAPTTAWPTAGALLSEPPRRDSQPRIPGTIPDSPRRASIAHDEAYAPPIRKSGNGMVIGLVVGGLGVFVVGVLACGGLGAYFLLARSPSAPAPVAMTAAAPMPVVKEAAAPPANNPPAPPAPDPRPNPPAQPKPDPQPNPVVPPPAPVVPPPLPVVPPPAPPPEPAGPVVWKVQPDSLPATLTLPDNSQGEIPAAGFSHQVVFPTSPSPFVAVGAGDGFNISREVWDLRTMKRVGVVPGGGFGGGDPVVSPDGAFVAAGAGGLKPTVDVWAVADGGNVKLAVGDGFLKGVDFAAPGQVLTGKAAGPQLQVDVWDIKTGKSVCQFKSSGGQDARKWAFSAGRKYLAVPRKDHATIYDLTTGEPAGDLATTGDCQGLAFSVDGKAVAGLFGAGVGASRLQVWDAATGKPTSTLVFTKGADNAFFYQGRPLEWLPDGSGWVLHGQLLVDAQSGVVYWNVPAEALDGNPRRVFAGGRVAHVKKDGQKLSVVLEAMPADKVAAALAAVRNGQDPGAAALPPAKAADWSAAKELSAPAGAAEWKAVADAAAAPKGTLGVRPIPLAGKGGDVVRLLFSRPDVGQAVVLTAANPTALGDQKQVHVDRYDLAGGASLGGADLFAAEFPKGRPVTLDADLSPDGALLAVREPKGGKRIDVWAAADGKHVVGWLPYEKGGDASIRWFAFTDEKHLLTLSGAGALALWDVPECKAEYSISFVRDLPALSPGRKYLAAFTGSNFEVLETATGARVGQLFGPNAQAVQAAAYRPDGNEFAAVLTTPGGPRLCRWDATTGAAKADFGVAPGGGDLEWCGADYAMFGPTLIDLTLKWPVAQYNLPGAGRQSPAGPDGRHWFVFSHAPNDPPILTAQKLPDDATLQLTQQAAAGQLQTVLAPGMALNVIVQGGGPDTDPDGYHRDLVTRQTQRLQALGFKTAADAPLTLTFQIQPARDTGKIRRYETLGGFPRRELDIHVIEVVVEGTLKDAQGGVLWTQKTSAFTPNTFGIVRAEDLQGMLNKEVWDRAAAWTGSAGPAAVLLRGPGGVEALPRPVTLAGDR